MLRVLEYNRMICWRCSLLITGSSCHQWIFKPESIPPELIRGIFSIKIPVQVVKLTLYGGFYFASPWLFLFGYIEKSTPSQPRSYLGLCLRNVECWLHRS